MRRDWVDSLTLCFMYMFLLKRKRLACFNFLLTLLGSVLISNHRDDFNKCNYFLLILCFAKFTDPIRDARISGGYPPSGPRVPEAVSSFPHFCSYTFVISRGERRRLPNILENPVVVRQGVQGAGHLTPRLHRLHPQI